MRCSSTAYSHTLSLIWFPADTFAEEMDKKLLLAVQYQCNLVGVAIPWTEIGAIMGEGITGGAVIQHLAKLRARMIAQGLSVPPPLRRGGGGSRISTAFSGGFKGKVKATPTQKCHSKGLHTE